MVEVLVTSKVDAWDVMRRSCERSLCCFNVIGEVMCVVLVVICYENGDLFGEGNVVEVSEVISL